MAATNAQVQAFVDSRVRPRCEQIRALINSINDDRAAFDDVYANLTNNPDWTDSRNDGPPHLLTPSDVLAYNTFLAAFQAFVDPNGDANTMGQGGDQTAIILKGCVRAV